MQLDSTFILLTGSTVGITLAAAGLEFVHLAED